MHSRSARPLRPLARSVLIPAAAAAISLLFSSAALAASYQQIDGTIIDPILDLDGNVSTYAGPDLGPGVDLSSYSGFNGLDLRSADLSDAIAGSSAVGWYQIDIRNADFQRWTGPVVFAGAVLADEASFQGANLASRTDFISAVGVNSFRFTDFSGANLSDAVFFDLGGGGNDFTGADFSFANLSNAIIDASSITGAPFYNSSTDFTGTGFDPVAAGWTLVPEPGTALLLGLGLTALAVRRGE